jgi:hypothetical protein
MGIQRRRLRRSKIAVAGTVAVLASAGSAFALQGLPPGGQVNDDVNSGINPALSVGGEDPANADVVGGALTAGKPAVPWAVFRQTEAGGNKDQVFSRSFAGGAWTTRGNGTVGGSSSGAPPSGSLNFDQGQNGEAPAIDFAGAGRTVPWATWYENTVGGTFGANNVFASRFDATQNKWVFAGQGRGNGGANNVPVPSLNIHTAQDAENPSVAGGNAGTPAAAPDPTKPGPWITWQETSTQLVGAIHPDQIFVERPMGPGSTSCLGVTPGGTASAPLGGFCWQQTGIDRFPAGSADPTLNIDPTRNGVEPDIAFTGAQDSVPWVVWYEKDATGTTAPNQLQSNEMVFAAKGVADASADGGMHWVAVGNGAQGVLDTTGTPTRFGTCAASATTEAQCSLNANTNADAEDPRVAGGTMNSANPTVPWVAWDEGAAGHHQVFVSRLVGTGADARFVPVNGGQPISPAGVDATRPDITFSGNTPYVTYRTTDGSGNATGTSGHFVNAANPTFVPDNANVQLTPTAQADVREPISSGCTANPFNADGTACQGGAVGTPFFLFTNGTSPLRLFATAYQPDAPVSGAATGVGQSTATVSGSVNPEGARANVSFQFGTTTAYGQTTPAQTTGPDNAADAFSAALTGLPAGTTIHYRAVATSDFGTQVGADQTLTTQKAPPPVVPGKASAGHARVSGNTASVRITCKGDTSCKVSLKLTVTETFRGHKLIAVSARKAKVTHKTVVLGTASATIKAGRTQTVRISLNRTGRKLLAAHHKLTAKLTVAQGHRTVSKQKVTFKAPKHHGRHGGH